MCAVLCYVAPTCSHRPRASQARLQSSAPVDLLARRPLQVAVAMRGAQDDLSVSKQVLMEKTKKRAIHIQREGVMQREAKQKDMMHVAWRSACNSADQGRPQQEHINRHCCSVFGKVSKSHM